MVMKVVVNFAKIKCARKNDYNDIYDEQLWSALTLVTMKTR